MRLMYFITNQSFVKGFLSQVLRLTMTDEYYNISSRTWMRTVDPINKAGYSDGVTDGQVAMYQASFDTGYDQGIKFGFNLGILNAGSQIKEIGEELLRDPRKINCQICLNNSSDENVKHLLNLQKEKNDLFLQKNTYSEHF